MDAYSNALVNGQLTAPERCDADDVPCFVVRQPDVNGKNIAVSWIWPNVSVTGAIGRKTSRFSIQPQ